MSGILIANSEKGTVAILNKLLKTEGYKVFTETDEPAAIEQLKNNNFDLVLTSFGGSFDPNMELLKYAATEKPSTPLVVILDNHSPELMSKLGDIKCFAVLHKPLKIDHLIGVVQKAVDFGDEFAERSSNSHLQLKSAYRFENIVAESAVMKGICDLISRLSGTEVTILITGDRGTGKGVIARSIHANSLRKEKPLVIVDCAKQSASGGMFVAAAGAEIMEKVNEGTLFLSKLDKLSMDDQRELTSILQKKKVTSISGRELLLDLRVLATADQDLESLVAKGVFLSDLQKVLKMIVVRIPPLRERTEDVLPMFRKIFESRLPGGSEMPVISKDALDALERYPWPGNATEMVAIADTLTKNRATEEIALCDLPIQIRNRI